VTFKFLPGQIYTGRVQSVLQATSEGQMPVSGLAVTPKALVSAPFIVRIKLDDDGVARLLPAGGTGEAAIYTDHVKVAHVVRQVMLRMIAIMNYIDPW
jgi:hypothetical protein